MQVLPVFILICVSILTIRGWFATDFQSQVLKLSSSPTSFELQKRFIVFAVQNYDYNLAQNLYNSLDKSKQVLGANSDFDSLLYPDKTLRVFRDNLLEKAKTQFSRQLYLQLAVTSWQLFDRTEAEKYLNLATFLDPNDPSIYPITQLLKLN